jgi:hypothetical protein
MSQETQMTYLEYSGGYRKMHRPWYGVKYTFITQSFVHLEEVQERGVNRFSFWYWVWVEVMLPKCLVLKDWTSKLTPICLCEHELTTINKSPWYIIHSACGLCFYTCIFVKHKESPVLLNYALLTHVNSFKGSVLIDKPPSPR